MRRTQLAGLLCILVCCLPTARAAHAMPPLLVPTTAKRAQAYVAASASPSCSNDPTIGSSVRTLAISDTLAFLGDDQALTILDVSDPARPTCRSHMALAPNSSITAIEVRGKYAYLALAHSNVNDIALQIVDVQDPDNPTLAGSFSSSGAYDLAVVGNVVYLAAFPDMQIIDVSDPAAPVLAGTYALGSSTNFKRVGNYLYLREGAWVFEILDLTDPLHPARVGGFYEGTISFYGFSISGDRAYLIRPGYGVEVLDLSHRNNPMKIGTYTNIVDGNTQTFGIQVIGNTLYIVGTKFEIYDVSSPTVAVRLGSYDPPGFGYDMRLVGNVAYLANPEIGYRTGDYGFEIIDANNKANPFLRGWFLKGNTGRFFYTASVRR